MKSMYVLPSIIAFVCLVALSLNGTEARRFTVPFLSNDEWASHNKAVKERISLLHFDLGSNAIHPKIAANSFVDILTEHFEEHNEFLDCKSNAMYIDHEPKTLSQARKRKNILRKKAFGKTATDDDRKQFQLALKTVSYLKKKAKESKNEKSRAHLEKRFRNNFYDFSKKACNGSLHSDSPKPSFSQNEADEYFCSKYSVSNVIDPASLNWFPYISVSSDEHLKFNMSAFKPKDVKAILKQKKAKSAPGEDGLMYGMLKHLNCTHHFLATLFNKVLESGDPPEMWSESKVILIHKAGETSKPENFRMISLTSCIGKIFNQILSERLTLYLTANGLIDKRVQKAFINGVNGCIEHNQVLHEILSHAKSKHRTLHITFFDLADAFGSVSHQLIGSSLERYAIPRPVSKYITVLYSRLNGKVCGPGWHSKQFTFRKGVFQGDPLSPIVFLMCFNPVLEYLESLKTQRGYDFAGERIITTPYADDFNLITGNKRHHQKIMNELGELLGSMGLQIKSRKCRSLSILSGKPAVVDFFIGNDKIKSVHDDPVKFLGSHITFSMKTTEIYEILHGKLNTILANIDQLNIRNEYKLKILTAYGLPSMRYMLTVHDLHNTHLGLLDKLLDKHIKKWLGIPCQGANIAIVHAPAGLDIPTISELYRTCHCLAYSRSKCKGDEVVVHALNQRLMRESTWTRKSSIIQSAHQMHENSSQNNWKNTKKAIKMNLKRENREKWVKEIEPLLVQGEFMKVLEHEKTDLSWKSIIYDMPQNVLKFAVNAAIDSLPSNKNLYRWGKRLNDLCSLCHAKGTLHHTLNNCEMMLKRYEWRQNNVIRTFLKYIKQSGLCEDHRVYADVEGESINGGTVPPDIVPT